jgi:TolB protein
VSEDFDPAWSPDGTQIAFVSDRDGNQEIYVVNIDGTNLQRLTWSEGSDRSPAWQPGR